MNVRCFKVLFIAITVCRCGVTVPAVLGAGPGDDLPAAADVASRGDTASQDELTNEAAQTVASLRSELAPDSEARIMLEDILQGRRLGPGDGWFRVSVTQNRYDWPSVASRYDHNQDGQISQDEFPGSAADFARLDRDRDGVITQADLDWRDHALANSPGAVLFRSADRDGNGKLTRDEWLDLYQELDSDSISFITLDDLRHRFPMPNEADRARRADRPSRSTLILGLARQEIGSLHPGPALNDAAPDFTLASLDDGPVTLSSEIGSRPIVLVFGNFTCGPFRSHAGDLEKLHQRYRDRAKFFLVYVREAHPSDGWWMTQNQAVGIDLAQPTSDEDRCDVAGICRQHLQLSLPFLVDTVADTAGTAYSGMPNRLYLIDRSGRVAFKSGRGPFGFKPAELEQALLWCLSEP